MPVDANDASNIDLIAGLALITLKAHATSPSRRDASNFISRATPVTIDDMIA